MKNPLADFLHQQICAADEGGMGEKMKTLITIITACAAICAVIHTHIHTACADTGLLWLVNKENSLPADFHPENLCEFKGVKLSLPAKEAFIKMLAAMESDGIYGLRLQSAYRSYEYQRVIFDQRVKELMAKGQNREEAVANASHSIQLPGASEHQLGLALDVSIDGKLSQKFATTDAGRWLEENCYKFGFIIRYPQAKTDITHIIYEPWHLRYVGIPHATIIKEESLTLEEYHRYLANIPMYVVWGDGYYFLVRYADILLETVLPETAEHNTEISRATPARNSGFIITQRKMKGTERS